MMSSIPILRPYHRVVLSYLLHQWKKTIFRSKVWSFFIYLALPLVVIFAVSLVRLGVLFNETVLGIAPSTIVIPTTVPNEVLNYETLSPKSLWRNDRQLVWVDMTLYPASNGSTSSGNILLNYTQLIQQLPGYTDSNTLQFTTVDEMNEYCQPPGSDPSSPCFAGIVFYPSSSASSSSAFNGTVPLNFTVHYPINYVSLTNLNVRTLGPYGSAGYLTLQMNIERGALAQLYPSLSSSILSSVTKALPYTSINQAEFNAQYLSYFADFMGNTASAAMALIFLPSLFWLAHTIATDIETRTKDAMIIMGLPSFIYFFAICLQYLLLNIPMWICASLLLTFMSFTTANYLTNFLLVTLTAVALVPCIFMFITTFFRKARLAGPVTALTFFVIGAVASQLRVLDDDYGWLRIVIALLFPPAGFSIGVTFLAEAEEAAIPMTTANWGTVIQGQGISIGSLFFAIFGSILLHMVLYSYLNCGTSTHSIDEPSSCLQRYYRSFFRNFTGTHIPNRNRTTVLSQEPSLATTATVRHGADDEDDIIREPLSNERTEKCMVRLCNVSKTYPGTDTPAVRNVSLECYDSEVLVLLGKNGCGKTTTVHMIAGLLPPSFGSITIGKEKVPTENTVGTNQQRTIGWCPQHDILWPDVSVRDTLILYAAIKGVTPSDISSEADRWIERAGLTEKMDALAGTLSGGQKRRLSLAAALIGDSRILLLDEPSAGVDPLNRRLLWDLLNTNKKGRTVLLTTHFLDEAEALGDRIAVMDTGKLRAVGTSLYLKEQLSLGPYLTVMQDTTIVTGTSDTPTTTAVAADRDRAESLVQFVRDRIPAVKLLSSERNVSVLGLPTTCGESLPSLLRTLESRTVADQFGITGLGLSSASLHDVFMKLIGTGEEKGSVSVNMGKESTAERLREGNQLPENGKVSTANVSVETDRIPSNIPFTYGDKLYYSGLRMYAVMRKRAFLTVKDLRTTVGLLVLIGCAAFAVAEMFKTEEPIICPVTFSIVPPASLISVLPNADNGTTFTGYPYGPSRTMLLTKGSPVPVIATVNYSFITDGTRLRGTLDQNPSSVWGGWDCSESLSTPSSWPGTCTLWYDISLPYADLKTLNTYHNGVYANVTGNPSAVLSTMQLQPFPVTESVFSSRNWSSFLGLIGVVTVAWAIVIPVISTLLIARERIVGLKMQQTMSGLHSVEYWMSNFVWDSVPAVVFAVILAAGLSSLPLWLPSFGLTVGFFFLYGMASVTWGYVLSFMVSTSAGAVALHATLAIAVAIGYVTGIVIAAPDPIRDYKIVEALSLAAMATHPLAALIIGVLLPGGNIFFTLCSDESATDYIASRGTAMDALALATFQRTSIALAAHAIIALCLVFVLDKRNELKLRLQIRPLFVRGCGCLRTATKPSNDSTDEETGKGMNDDVYGDDDVVAERDRILAAYGSGQDIPENGTETDNVIVMDVKKRFWIRNNEPPVQAVKGVTFGLSSNECYAHIGKNGAGKTTLLRIISGQELPDKGRVIINGHELQSDLNGLRRCIGVCPQFDVLYGELSAVEHIRYYAALRGIPPGKTTENEIQRLITRLDLLPHAHKASAALSGGNKRKLSVALALIGQPPVILLDEPTTGMDPASKRFMWSMITDLRKHHTIVLTTHSMEECEAVAQRVGIMVSGRMTALASLPRLKIRFGQEYQIDAVCGSVDDVYRMKTVLEDQLPGTRMAEHHGQQVRFVVPLDVSSSSSSAAAEEKESRNTTVRVSLSRVLDIIEEQKHILNIRAYQTSQTTLEQIFLGMVNKE